MTMLQAFAQVVSVVLGLCKLNTILNRMVKAAQLGWAAFSGYRTKRVGFIGDGASKLLAPSLF